MSLKQLKAKYAGSILGISWAVLTPLLLMSVITFVFLVIFKTGIKNFPLFVLSGIFPWMFFSSSLSEATVSIVSQRAILHQFSLPREIIPISTILSNFLNFLIGWVIMYPLFLLFNFKILLLFPFLAILVLLHFLFLCGLGLVMSALNVLFRDINHLLEILLMFWFWITPIFYSMDMIPERFRWICVLNPMSSYIVYYKYVVFWGNAPGYWIFFNTCFWAFASLFFGLFIFSRLESKLLKLT